MLEVKLRCVSSGARGSFVALLSVARLWEAGLAERELLRVLYSFRQVYGCIRMKLSYVVDALFLGRTRARST
jgi:hypothetical protein